MSSLRIMPPRRPAEPHRGALGAHPLQPEPQIEPQRACPPRARTPSSSPASAADAWRCHSSRRSAAAAPAAAASSRMRCAGGLRRTSSGPRRAPRSRRLGARAVERLVLARERRLGRRPVVCRPPRRRRARAPRTARPRRSRRRRAARRRRRRPGGVALTLDRLQQVSSWSTAPRTPSSVACRAVQLLRRRAVCALLVGAAPAQRLERVQVIGAELGSPIRNLGHEFDGALLLAAHLLLVRRRARAQRLVVGVHRRQRARHLCG